MKKNIHKVFYLFLAGFLVIMLNLTYIQFYQSAELFAHPLNVRVRSWEQRVVRGGIYDRYGETLAENVWQNGKPTRFYPLGEAGVAVTGYLSEKKGRTGLEAEFNMVLLGTKPELSLGNLLHRFSGAQLRGNDLLLTLDADLQRTAYRLLQGQRGAAVVLDPKSGAVLAAASSPGFNPNRLDEQWDGLINSRESPLLNRVLQGLYPPGSTFKMLSGAVILDDNSQSDQLVNCPGYIKINGRILECLRPHGYIGFTDAISYSCNVFFATRALATGAKDFYRGALRFGFNHALDFDLPVKESRIPPPKELKSNALAECSIGQGKVLVTPLHMALITAAVANGGTLFRPYLVEGIRSPNGVLLQKFKPHQVEDQLLEAKSVNLIREGMRKAVREGTAKTAGTASLEIAGKTGTAENPHGLPHAWFAAFAPADDPEVVVVVLIENSGHGGQVAAPVARDLLVKALEYER